MKGAASSNLLVLISKQRNCNNWLRQSRSARSAHTRGAEEVLNDLPDRDYSSDQAQFCGNFIALLFLESPAILYSQENCRTLFETPGPEGGPPRVVERVFCTVNIFCVTEQNRRADN